MEPDTKNPGKNPSEDLKTFDDLPAEARKLLLLGDKAEKTTGKDRAELNHKIHSKSAPPEQ